MHHTGLTRISLQPAKDHFGEVYASNNRQICPGISEMALKLPVMKKPHCSSEASEKGKKQHRFSPLNRINNARYSTICGVLMPFKSAPGRDWE